MKLTPKTIDSLVEDMIDDLIVDINTQIRHHKMDSEQAYAFRQEIVKALGARLDGENE